MERKSLLVLNYIGISRSFAENKGVLALISEAVAIVSMILVVFVTIITLRRTSKFEKLLDFDKYIKQNKETGDWFIEERLGKFIQVIGATMFQSAKMSMLQGLSADRKLEKGLEKAMVKDIMEEKIPVLGLGADLIDDFLGYNVKSYIMKNPRAVFQILAQPGVQTFLTGLMGRNNGAQRPQLPHRPQSRMNEIPNM